MQLIINRIVALIALVAMGLGAWLTFDNLPFSNEIIVYQAWCPTPRTEAGVCRAGEESANPITFKAFPETQSVVYWFKDKAPSRMKNCAVRDARNWSCHQGEGYATAMVNGKQEKTSKLGQMFYQVPKYRWYWLWLHTKTF